MSRSLLDPAELRQRGFEALVEALGWVDAVRFMQQYETSRLDYTAEPRRSLSRRSPVRRTDDDAWVRLLLAMSRAPELAYILFRIGEFEVSRLPRSPPHGTSPV